MPESSGYFHTVQPGDTEIPALILLHGSGQDETTLAGFGQTILPAATRIALRGTLPWEGGFAFFRRHADRTLDLLDLSDRAATLCGFIRYATKHYDLRKPPILAGYSNGAIIAAAAICQDKTLTSGAILLRPLSPSPGDVFPPLDHYPVLIIAGEHDKRRDPQDAPFIARQFRDASAGVTYHSIPAGHGWSNADQTIARAWLEDGRHKPPRTRY
ncbi:alpha/beta hydrolase [Phyllobacterium myrsinacearum]|uniref:Phospholipase/carboxylesterase n=1 Tax=Phyllobacterium myrsinacearum TaxID=28101 RepID=A0A839EK25_9HYPH|nr:alpha/beta hydrolase [Phyllobacterium myrsinacearum]MBA8876847.1 phospholipase/carboxylesterase [Phyllobacterium myrsinacearum]